MKSVLNPYWMKIQRANFVILQYDLNPMVRLTSYGRVFICISDVLLILFLYLGSPSLALSGESTITITGVGDLMLGTHYPTTEYLPQDDGVTLFDGVKDLLRSSDITFGNLEGSLLDEGVCIKQCKNPDTCYAFKMPERYLSHLKDAGFNLLSLANNHIGDFGLKGRNNTLRLLKMAGIQCAGIDSRPYCIFDKHGMTIGFCAFSPNVGIPDIRDIDSAAALVRQLDKRCDIVIVSFHGGAEGAENRHIHRENEVFYGENRGNVYGFSHAMIDAGADVIFGHGPHVTRAVELYHDRFIAYSLGNFCTYGRFNLLDYNGLAPIIRMTLNKQGMFKSGQVIPIVQEFKKGPKPDIHKKALYELIELSTSDFPESPLIIHESGDLTVPSNSL